LRFRCLKHIDLYIYSFNRYAGIVKMRTALLIIISLLLMISCAKPINQGKVVGVTASFDVGDASDGLISNMYYEGELILEKADGEKVNALCDTSLIGDIRGGQWVEIAFDKDLEKWKVVAIVKESE